MYKQIDDCNIKFIDCVALKRFLSKCGIRAKDGRIISIVRRLDMDADAKLSKNEFLEAITPQEASTKQ